MHMQVLDQQLVFMCEGVQSDLPYSTKCEKYTVSKTIYKTCGQLLLFFISYHYFYIIVFGFSKAAHVIHI